MHQAHNQVKIFHSVKVHITQKVFLSGVVLINTKFEPQLGEKAVAKNDIGKRIYNILIFQIQISILFLI